MLCILGRLENYLSFGITEELLVDDRIIEQSVDSWLNQCLNSWKMMMIFHNNSSIVWRPNCAKQL